MATKQKAEAGNRITELEADRGKAEEALQGHRERLAAVQKELEAKEGELRKLDVALSEQVESLLRSIPPDDSARLVAELEQFRQAGRFELTEQIEVLRTAVRAEQAQVVKAEGEVKQIAKLIQQASDDEEARSIHGEGMGLIEKIKVANGARLRLNDMVKASSIRDWPERFKRLGLKFPLTLGVLLQSHLQRANIDTLDLSRIAQALVDIGHAYGEKPLVLPGTPHGSEDIPMVRDYYFNKDFSRNQ